MKFKLALILALIHSPIYANVTGSDLQIFNATTNGLDFVTVHSSETLIPGIANLGLFGNYAVNTLPRYDESGATVARSNSVQDSVLASDFNFGLGLTRNIDMGISIPSVVYQDIKDEGARGEFGNTGVTEIRANVKYRFLGEADGGMAVVASINQNLTQNNPFTGSNPGPILNLELVGDILLYRTAFAVNIGYRKRNPGDPVESFPIEPLQDQVIWSGAISQHMPSLDTKVIFEVFAASPVKETNTGSSRDVSASEALLGIKYDYDRNVAIHLGASTEMSHGTASPDWRAYTGINYVTGHYTKKKVKLTVKKKPKPKKRKKKTGSKPQLPPPPLPVIPESLTVPDNYPPEPPGVGDDVVVLRDVNFAFDSDYKVVAGAKEALDTLADHLEKRGYQKVIIEGHTDSLGSDDYNINLGRRRAQTIRNYLVKVKKLDASKIKVLTYGEFRPIADNGNYQGRQINRRVVFRILY
ncbi:MAG: OmpA family protein [Pseudobacteriovorax sp.]|nr:OmpA family protein [Pseudobacteriovorax sp.]